MMVSTAVFVLTIGSNAMLFHADTAFLRAVERDLIASGLAWTRAQVSNRRDLPVGESVELDVAAFACPSARLAVRVLDVKAGQARVRIETSCSKGRRTLGAARDYTVAIP
jgi:hypothetical protein